MSSSLSSPINFYHNNDMGHYLSNESFLLGNNTSLSSPPFTVSCNCSDCMKSFCTVKNTIYTTMPFIKNEGENFIVENIMLPPNITQTTNIYDYDYTYYPSQSPLYTGYENNNYFMGTNSTSSSSSPPPLLSPEFNKTEVFHSNEVNENSNYYYNTVLEYPLVKTESISCYEDTKKESTATANGNKIGYMKRLSSPESMCSVSSSAVKKRKFTCNYCDRSFARKYDLSRHQRIHTGSKPYVCPCCSKGFSRSDARIRHFRTERLCQEGAMKISRHRNQRIR